MGVCGCSAAGSASRCQREGRGFESRLPLQHFSPSREVWGLVPAPASTEGSRGPCTAPIEVGGRRAQVTPVAGHMPLWPNWQRRRLQVPKVPGSNPGRGTTRHGSITGGDSGKGGCDTPPPHLYGDVAHHARLPQGVPGQPGATAVRVRRQKGRRVLTFAPAPRSAGTAT